ncbi:MAG: hypothetical protein JEY99_16610 [Spirochaetales bacterium]|nr:hypothetical protein [Spirochaetales bacterium]
MRKVSFFIAVFLITSIPCLMAQSEGSELLPQDSLPETRLPLDYLAEKELVVSLSTRIMETQEKTLWKIENTKITLSGEAVSVKMAGENLVIFAQITPYMQDDGTILLVAEGEVFISSEEEGTQYYTTLKSLPVHAGEKVLFFPLGMAVDSEQNLYYIELEIQVLPKEMVELEENDQ